MDPGPPDWWATASQLMTIRPDGGAAWVEDASTGRRTAHDPVAVAQAIVRDHAQAPTVPHAADASFADWIDNGWRPSLDYFLWSERPTADGPAPPTPSRPSPPASESRSKRWEWPPPDDDDDDVLVEPRSVGEVLLGRRTHRVFEMQDLPQRTLVRVLDSARQFVARTSEAEGIDVQLIAYAVEGLDAGIWSIDLAARTGHLRIAGPADHRRAMSRIMCGMPAALSAAGTLVFTVDMERRMQRFPYERGLRELYIEVGRYAQWLILAGETLGVGSLITPATNDVELADLIQLASSEAPIYTLTLGLKPSASP